MIGEMSGAFGGWFRNRDLPPLAEETFHERWERIGRERLKAFSGISEKIGGANGESGRDEILGRLKTALKTEIPGTTSLPPLMEASLGREELVKRFVEMFTAETGIVYRAKDNDQARERLTEIAGGRG